MPQKNGQSPIPEKKDNGPSLINENVIYKLTVQELLLQI